jgi:transcriptional regulator with XRE-family HTH domain
MSIPLSNETRRNVNTPCAKRFVVNKEQQPESLADYVQRVRNEKNLSLMDVSRRSGGLIANAHISRIENGWVKSVGIEKLRALAKGLGVPEDEIFSVARGSSNTGDLQSDELRLVHFYRGIPYERKLDLLSYSEMLFTRYGDQGARVSNGGPQSGKVYEAVAGIPKAVRDGRKKADKASAKKK